MPEASPQIPRALSIRSLLLLVATLPLCGVMWFAFGQISDARQQVAVTAELDEGLKSASELTELQVALTAEAVWNGLLSALAELQLSEGMAAAFTGVDFRAELSLAANDVDRLVDELELTSVQTSLSTTRSVPPNLARDYVEAIGLVASERRAAQRNVTETVADSAGSAALLFDVRGLEHSSDLWLALSKQLQLYLSLQFPQFAEGFDPMMLAEARGDHRRALAALEVNGETSPELARLVDELRSSESHLAINEAIDSYLARVVSGVEPDAGEAPILETGVLLGVVGESAELHAGLLAFTSDAASSSLAAQAAAVAERSRQVWILVALVGLASIALVAVTARQINRPLRALAESAEALNDGRPHAVRITSGPRETRIVGDAIGETSRLLALVERQAEALAVGDLEDPSLSSNVPGNLGASLQGAVAKLTSSLADRSEFERLLRHEANHDALTGLANRRAALRYIDELDGLSGHATTPVAVLLMDLDGFKAVNDVHGHHGGDQVLRVVAERLSRCVRQQDLVARMGGDEFLMVIRDCSSIVEAMAERIVAAIAEPIDIDGTQVAVGVSVGIAESDGSARMDIDQLMHRADAASYRAKSQGGDAAARWTDREISPS